MARRAEGLRRPTAARALVAAGVAASVALGGAGAAGAEGLAFPVQGGAAKPPVLGTQTAPALPSADLPKPPPAGAGPGRGAAAPSLPPVPRPPPYAREPGAAAHAEPLRLGVPVPVRLGRNESAYFVVAPEVASRPYSVVTRNLGPGTDTVLMGLDAGGNRVVGDDDGGDEALASRIRVAPGDGVATIRASILGGDPGSFEVLVAAEVPRPPPAFATSPRAALARPPLEPGASVRLDLGRGEAAHFALPARRDLVAVTRDLVRNTDTVLALVTPDGAEVDSDDDGGGGLASRLELWDAPPGPLVLVARTIAGLPGQFTLALEVEASSRPPAPAFPNSPLAARARGPLAVGEAVAVTLSGQQAAVFALPVGAPLAVSTRNLSPGTDTVLSLLDEDGEEMTTDDDGGAESLASRVETEDAPRPAAFVRATLLGGGRGSFELVVDAVAPAPPPSDVATTVEEARARPPLVLGEARALRLRGGGEAVFALPDGDGSLAMALTFGLRRDADTVLEMLDASGEVIADDDDGGGGLASLLPLPDVPRPAFLRARLLGDRPGEFSLVLVRRAAEEADQKR